MFACGKETDLEIIWSLLMSLPGSIVARNDRTRLDGRDQVVQQRAELHRKQRILHCILHVASSSHQR